MKILTVQQALTQAAAGVDMVAPSDMMDGRIGAIRQGAGSVQGHVHTRIMAYSAKYASAFYGPFRDAVGSRRATWARPTRRSTRWTRATATKPCGRWRMDIAEGADMVMVKPGMPYLDIVRRVKDEFHRCPPSPTRSAANTPCSRQRPQNGWLDHDAVMMESLMAFKRAGCRRPPDLLSPATRPASCKNNSYPR